MKRIQAFLQKRKTAGTLRSLRPLEKLGSGRLRPAAARADAIMLDFSSNDYLALSEHPEVIAESQKFIDEWGAGAGAARLMSGDLEIHRRLEKGIARLKGQEDALLFGSGYLANIGVIPALAGRGDAVFCDRLNHASIYDGCKLSAARTFRFRHNDPADLEKILQAKRGDFQEALIVVESIYSMDGDRCPLTEIVELKKRFNCLLMVDEAHATGLYGRNGGGVIEEDGVGSDVDLAMGTLGKALGSYGAYVAATAEMVSFLINRARSFIYSTALPPAVAGATLAALEIIRKNPGLRRELHDRVKLFKDCLRENGCRQDLGPSQIVPIMVGDSKRALSLAGELMKNNIFAVPVRPPTVPEGTARLRFSITRHQRPADLEAAAEIVLKILRKQQG